MACAAFFTYHVRTFNLAHAKYGPLNDHFTTSKSCFSSPVCSFYMRLLGFLSPFVCTQIRAVVQLFYNTKHLYLLVLLSQSSFCVLVPSVSFPSRLVIFISLSGLLSYFSPPPAVPLFVFPQIANIDRPHFTLIPFYFKTFSLLRATSMVFTVFFVRRLDDVGGLALRR